MPAVLIIEDELIIAKMYSMVIERNGWNVTGVCSNAEKTWKSLATQVPDVIVLDVGLKNNECGIQLCKEIRKKYAIPVIFTTGNSNVEVEQAIRAIDKTEILIKPVNEKKLLLLIDQFTGNPK